MIRVDASRYRSLAVRAWWREGNYEANQGLVMAWMAKLWDNRRSAAGRMPWAKAHGGTTIIDVRRRP